MFYNRDDALGFNRGRATHRHFEGFRTEMNRPKIKARATSSSKMFLKNLTGLQL